ncbi:Uncharacterized conserved protein [Sphingobacterium spiritivorum]|uniref:Uncharacterized conserved protein n=1 Tax=Sphingobacterium spiritivorum TaxID=258 RepID=A0A380CUL4_SPHSI|nr:DUF1801 domain-containing protein [Sphingobacterium spiritivorum]SUJ27826.1 Uncharacterized conserved protein [Sphingobacterium spiritivorum]
MKTLADYYLSQQEPHKSCLLALRDIIVSLDPDITHELKYGMPFFCYKGKMFCYLWIHKSYNQPYIGIVEGKRLKHPLLITEKRARMKIMLLDPDQDLPISLLKDILYQAIQLYKDGIIAIPNKKSK